LSLRVSRACGSMRAETVFFPSLIAIY